MGIRFTTKGVIKPVRSGLFLRPQAIQSQLLELGFHPWCFISPPPVTLPPPPCRRGVCKCGSESWPPHLVNSLVQGTQPAGFLSHPEEKDGSLSALTTCPDAGSEQMDSCPQSSWQLQRVGSETQCSMALSVDHVCRLGKD